MFQTKRFGLVASKQEYLMLCRAERHMKRIKEKEHCLTLAKQINKAKEGTK